MKHWMAFRGLTDDDPGLGVLEFYILQGLISLERVSRGDLISYWAEVMVLTMVDIPFGVGAQP